MDYLKLIRYKNLLFVALLQCLMYFCVVCPILEVYQIENPVPNYVFWIMMLGTVCVSAAGYVINDYFDTKIDALNRPNEVIVGEKISRDTASRLHAVLAGVGILCGLIVAFVSKSLTIGVVFILVPGLLWFYSASYKRQFLIGNIIISFCSALSVLVVEFLSNAFLVKEYGEMLAYQSGIPSSIHHWVFGFAAFAFLLTLIREIVKDMEDEYGDRELELRTMPVVWGFGKTKVFVASLIVLCMILLFWALSTIRFSDNTFNFLRLSMDMSSLRYMICAVIAPLIACIYLLIKAKKPSEFTLLSNVLKVIMLAGSLYSVLFYALLAKQYGLVLFNLFILK